VHKVTDDLVPYKNRIFLASCKVFTAMTVKVTVLWDAAPYLLEEIYLFFWEELSAFLLRLEVWLSGD
jgi:hypothetical protein